ncbi:MAG: hypothetical protein ACRCWR_10975 [Saezia sp.]
MNVTHREKRELIQKCSDLIAQYGMRNTTTALLCAGGVEDFFNFDVLTLLVKTSRKQSLQLVALCNEQDSFPDWHLNPTFNLTKEEKRTLGEGIRTLPYNELLPMESFVNKRPS